MKLNQHNNSTTIYLQQIQNHITIGQGYDTIRKHLFRELYRLDGENMSSDDKLPQAIVSHLTIALDTAYNFHRSQQTFRIIQIIEDFMVYVSQIMTPEMHKQSFLSSLINISKPKMVSFHSDLDAKCRNHVFAIFSSWNNQYSKEEECPYPLFIYGYQQIKENKWYSEELTPIKSNPFFKNQYQNQKNQKSKSNLPAQDSAKSPNRIILEQIQQFTQKSQQLLKQSIKKVATTQYVRLIKHKSKVLYEFTSKPGDFNEKQKGKVKDFYKRLRTILKQIEKYNQNAVQIKKNKISEALYVEEKLTPKKSSQQSIEESSTNVGSGDKNVEALKNKQSDKKSDKQIKIVSPQKTLPNKINKTQSFDLLQFDFQPQPQTSAKVEVEPTKASEEQIKVNSSKSIKSPQQVKPLFQNFDLLGDITEQQKPQSKQKPKQKEEQQQFVDGILIDVNPIEMSLSSKQQQQQLQKIFSTPKKQTQEEQGKFVSKDNSPTHAFENQKQAKNPYSFIPNDINLTPTSSNQDEQQKIAQKTGGFNFFGLFKTQQTDNDKYIYDHDKKPYDDYPYRKNKQALKKTPQKQSTQSQIVFCQTILNQYKQQQQKKYVQPIDYSKYAVFTKSPKSDHSVQDEQVILKPQKQQFKDLNDVSLDFNKNSGEKIKLGQQ